MLKRLCLHGERYLLMLSDLIYSYFIEDFFYRINLYNWPLNNMRIKDVHPYSGFSFLMLHRLLKITPHFSWLSVWTKIFFFSYGYGLSCSFKLPLSLASDYFFYKSFLIL